MRVTCKYCGGPHPAFECRKKESTAARKDVPLSPEDSPFARGKESAGGAKAARDIGSNPRPPAGTQALPVDTNGSEAQKVERWSPKPEAAGSIPATLAKFDKKTWMREYMRDHRKGILRRPKPTAKREKDE